MYCFQSWRSFASASANFQFLSGRSSRSRKRRFCSLRETFRKNFKTSVPLRARCFSMSAMLSNRSFQIFFVTRRGGSFWPARIGGCTRTTSVSS